MNMKNKRGRKRDDSKWQSVYNYVVQYKANNDGLSPSVRDIASECDISSTSHVTYIIDGMEDLAMTQRGIKVRGGRWRKTTN